MGVVPLTSVDLFSVTAFEVLDAAAKTYSAEPIIAEIVAVGLAPVAGSPSRPVSAATNVIAVALAS